MLDPESRFIDELRDKFLSLMEKEPREAKRLFADVLYPYLHAQVRTIRLLEDQFQGCYEENGFLLRCNVLLIDALKQNNVPLPNFTQVKADVRKELSKESLIITP